MGGPPPRVPLPADGGAERGHALKGAGARWGGAAASPVLKPGSCPPTLSLPPETPVSGRDSRPLASHGLPHNLRTGSPDSSRGAAPNPATGTSPGWAGWGKNCFGGSLLEGVFA